MATSTPKTTPEKIEEEIELEAERKTTTEKKVVFEMTSEDDEQPRKIGEDEEPEEEGLIQIRADEEQEEVQCDQCELPETELRAELKALRTENDRLKQQVAKLQHVTDLSTAQKNTIKCLEHKIKVAEHIAIETQLRELDELRSLTKETEKLKQTLTAQRLQQQQQQPAAEEHHQGTFQIFFFSVLFEDEGKRRYCD